VEQRESVASEAVKKTLNEMREEEEKNLRHIFDRIDKHGKERTRLAKELNLTLDDPDSTLGLVPLERVLRREVEELREKKKELMEEVLELKRQDKALCRILSDVEPFPISSTVIPSKDQLQQLKNHLHEMQILHNQRQGRFVEMKLSILGLLEKLEIEPDNSFERTVTCEQDEAFVLAAANLDNVETFLGRLESKLEENRKTCEQMRKRIFSLIDKLELGKDVQCEVEHTLAGHSPAEMKEVMV